MLGFKGVRNGDLNGFWSVLVASFSRRRFACGVRIPPSRVSAYATSEYLDFFYLLDWAREARVSRLSKMVKVGGIALGTDNSSRGQI